MPLRPSSDIAPEPRVAGFRAPSGQGTKPGPPDFDRVINLLPGFVYIFNHAEQSNEYTNRSVAAYLGYSSEEILAEGDQIIARVVHPDDIEGIISHFGRIAKLDDKATASFEYRVLHKDGRQRWLRSVDSVFDRAADGTVMRHIGCASDVTAEKEAELQLAQLNVALEDEVNARTAELARLNEELEARIAARTAELEDAADELEELTFVATHDLKAPITNLSRIANGLQDFAEGLDPEVAEQIGWIGQCSDQLDKKIAGMVLVAQLRLRSGLPTTDVLLRDIIARVLSQQRTALRRAGARVHVDVPRDLTVRFSTLELESILSTLIHNALAYAHPDRPLELRLTVYVRPDAELCELSVIDNGTGLDMTRDLPKVFGLFQRAHVEPPGSGIALHCARRMLHRRGGSIMVQAEKGKGAEFAVVLPTAQTGENAT